MSTVGRKFKAKPQSGGVKEQKNNNEICLEFDMDESVRDLIKSLSNYSSTLLDVTVIKQKQSSNDKGYITQTSTLNCAQVRKLIASMEMGNNDKIRLLDKIFFKKSNDAVLQIVKHQTHGLIDHKATCSSQFEENPTPATYKIEDVEFRNFRKYPLTRTSSEFCLSSRRIEGGDLKNEQQIYTTARSYKQLQSVFACKNKTDDEDDSEKKAGPCYCKNCALMGIITDTQKKPLFAGPIESSGFEEKRSRRASEHMICNLQYTRLAERVNELEERLAMQEERSVAKDYFKRIITKLVSHITKITSSTHNHKYSNKKYSQDKSYPIGNDKRYYVNPLIIDDPIDEPIKKSTDNTTQKKTEESNTQSDSFGETDGIWRWGGEILRPGIDLKNKIVQLMEDYLKTVKKKMNQSELLKTSEENDIKIYVDVLSDHLYHRNLSNKSATTATDLTSDSTTYEMRKDFMHIGRNHYRHPTSKEVNIAYFNPRVAKWQDSSVDTLEIKVEKKTEPELCREKFKNILQNTKAEGKKKLWNTIWNQAVANGQSKKDRVTIQIPNYKTTTSGSKMCEIYYTIAELEVLLNSPRGHHGECL